MNTFKVTVEKAFRPDDSLRQKWDEAAARCGGSIYMSYDWCKTWCQFYATGKEVRIFLCSLGDEIVGILPIYIDALGFGPLQFRVARLIGANIPPKAFNPPVRSDCAESFFDSVLTQLLEQDRCDLVSIGPVSETCGFIEQFEQAGRQRRDAAGVTRTRQGLHTVFHLPKTMDEFFETLDKDERKKRKYEMRLLAREQSVTRDVVTAPDKLEIEFEEFTRLHALQWADRGRLGHFGSWPKGKEYNAALLKALAASGRVRFVRILAEGQVISNQYAFVFGNTWYWELPARAMGRAWNRFSLGTTGFFSLVEEAIKEGKTHIEGGIAHYDYKQKLNGTEYGMDILRVVGGSAGSRFRTKIYGCLRRALELVYYKIWYGRISPRLPALLRKPIWTFWLRLDF